MPLVAHAFYPFYVRFLKSLATQNLILVLEYLKKKKYINSVNKKKISLIVSYSMEVSVKTPVLIFNIKKTY